MNRTRVLSGLVGLGLAVGFAGGQPPAKPETKPAEKELLAESKAPPKGSLEDAITTALRSNPDVRVAEAEVQVAQAKLTQAKLAVAQKVAAGHAAVEKARADVVVAEATFSRVEAIGKKGYAPKEEGEAARQRLEVARAALARAEADYNAVLGVMPGRAAVAAALVEVPVALHAEVGTGTLLLDVRSALVRGATEVRIADPAKPVAGSAAERLREALDRPVKLPDQNRVELAAFLTALTRAAGLDLRIRVPPREDPALFKEVLRLTVPGGEYPLGTWFQLALDEAALAGMFDGRTAPNPLGRPARYEVYVRDYGLLVADPKNAPPGAPTVQDLWKQPRTERAAIPAAGVSGAIAEKLRAGLDKQVNVAGEKSLSLQTFLDWLNKEADLGLTFRVVGDSVAVTVQPGTHAVGAILQLIEDEYAELGLRFVVRDYGVMATRGKTLPPGAVTVQEFWKQARAEKDRAAKDAPKK